MTAVLNAQVAQQGFHQTRFEFQTRGARRAHDRLAKFRLAHRPQDETARADHSRQSRYGDAAV